MAESPHLGFHCDAGDPDLAELALVGVEGREALSEPYAYELTLLSRHDQGLSAGALEALLSNRCSISVGEATIGGVLQRIVTLPTVDAERVLYRATLVPALARLATTIRSRVFQTQSVIEIVASVLTEHGIAHRFSVVASYPVHEYVVQYAESDLAFVHRLLEHWGIFYLFEQSPDGEGMILADRNQALVAHPSFATLSFSPDPAADPTSAHVGPMTRTITPRTGAVTLRDYDWRAPHLGEDGTMRARQLQLRASAPVDEATGRGEIWRYGDHFRDATSGQLLANVRAEQELVDRVVLEAAFRAEGLAPGHRVSAIGMPLSDLDGEYVITETRLEVSTGGSAPLYAQQLRAIPSDVAYRPAMRTPKPKITGFMHAVIDGEVSDSMAAPIDALGRYKVIMPYDVAAAPGGRASRWIRMAQPSAGSDYGMHLPLHVGTEVAIYHLDGDPDRPVIAGSIPNVDTTSPVVDANATQSRIKTRGNILFELEDDA